MKKTKRRNVRIKGSASIYLMLEKLLYGFMAICGPIIFFFQLIKVIATGCSALMYQSGEVCGAPAYLVLVAWFAVLILPPLFYFRRTET